MSRSQPTPHKRSEHILITVRTYPTPSAKDVEVSCTAGITSGGELIRLFPIPYRLLDGEKRFHKYQEIQGRIWKSNDPRPESYKVDPDSIELGRKLGTANRWAERWDRIAGVQTCCMCCLREEQRKDESAPTLGFIIPDAIEGLSIEPTSSDWSADQLAKLSRASLWQPGEVKLLEKLPYRFKYRYRCPHDHCATHTQSCTDWEIGESFRKWRDIYGGDWEEKFRQKYEHQMIHKYDTGFFVGTMHNHPMSWLVVGLWYPLKGPRQTSMPLISSEA